MKIYISGKITGDPGHRDKFAVEELKLKNAGHIVLNPASLPDGLTTAELTRLRTDMLDIADCAYFLPDWEISEGAKLERAYCDKVGKPYVAAIDTGRLEQLEQELGGGAA